MTLPVVSDLQQLLRRLAIEERDRQRELAELEDRLRRFEDIERPAHDTWRRLAFGPVLAAIDELQDELRARRILAGRVMDLVERHGLRPREALYVATNPQAPEAAAAEHRGGHDPDEVEARRRAKVERKRAARKQAAHERKATARGPQPEPSAADQTIRRLYRVLARWLHPDSPSAIRTLAAERIRTIWTEVQSAYTSQNVDQLLAITAWVEAAARDAPTGTPADEFQGTGVLTVAERYTRLRALTRSARALERRVAQLADNPAWGFAPNRVRRTFHEQTARALAADAAQLREALAAVDEFLDAIGSPRRPRGRSAT